MSSVKINGVTYSGNNISISGNKIRIDGKDFTPDSKTIEIIVTGDINVLNVDSCEVIRVTGSVRQIETVSGDVMCDNVSGNVSTVSGSVSCSNVGGNVKTVSGNVK